MNSREKPDTSPKRQRISRRESASSQIQFPIPAYQPIPPGWDVIPAVESGESLVCLDDFLNPDSRVVLSPIYFQEGLENSSPRMYSRSSVAAALVKAASLLPANHKLIVYDAYRSPETQQALYERERANMKTKHPDLQDADLDALTQQYVSLPSWDKMYPSPHASGGAVDLSIVGQDGLPLDMGTTFDSLDESSHTANYMHSTDPNEMEYHRNRQLLYDIMRQAGFTNYPNEWWHFDIGNRPNAAVRGLDHAVYGLPENPEK